MKRPRDIEARIHFFTTEEGGKTRPVFSDYRPQFYYNGRDWDAPHEYPDVAEVKPGDTVRAYLAFLSPQCHLGKIYEGMKFQVREGAKVVAEGEVTRILKLEESAKRACERDPDCMKNC
jgi:translation elongation factor EF-Tu-like GTPase